MRRLIMMAVMVLSAASLVAAQSGTLQVHIVDEDGKPLAARIHVQDAGGSWVLPPGEPSKRRTEHGGPFADEYFYADGQFRLEVAPGPTTVVASAGLNRQPVQQTVEVPASGVGQVTLTLKRLIDLRASGWYSGDIHLHRTLSALGAVAEDINVGLHPHCHDIFATYSQRLVMEEMPDALHLRSSRDGASRVHAIEGNCYIWDLPRPITINLDGRAWPEQIKLGEGMAWRGALGFVQPFVYKAAHEGGGTVVAYMHDTRRRLPGGYYPLIIANGWIHIYSGLDNAMANIANSPEARFQSSFDNYWNVYYRFLNCGFRLPLSGGSDLTAVGSSLWAGYNRTFVKLDGEFSWKAWKENLVAGRSFVTNRPLLFVTVNGEQAGIELALRGADRPRATVDIEIVSATAVDRVEILFNGRVAQHVRLDEPTTRLSTRQSVPIEGSGWLAVRCFGRGDNRNMGPRFAIAHTSPWYLIVDGQPIRSPEDEAYFADLLRKRLAADLPSIQDPQVRAAFEAMAANALRRYGQDAE
jgi:hypothetical protein